VLLGIHLDRVEADGRVAWNLDGRTIKVPFDTKVTTRLPGKKTLMHWLRVDTATGEREMYRTREAFRPVPPLIPRFDSYPMPAYAGDFFLASSSYFIVSGLVFGVVSNPLLKQVQAGGKIPWSLARLALYRWRRDLETQLVILVRVLSHPCNMFYDSMEMRVLKTFNGQRVVNLSSFVQQVSAAEHRREEFLRFTFAPVAGTDEAGGPADPDIVLNSSLCASNDERLVGRMGIPSRMSTDMLPTYRSRSTATEPSVPFAASETGSSATFSESDPQASPWASLQERRQLTKSGRQLTDPL